MELTSSKRVSSKLKISSKQTVLQGTRQAPRRSSSQRLIVPSDLLRCLVVSWSDQRAELFRAAAENEAWQAIICQDVGQFVRHVFRQKVPLTIVDLPSQDADGYAELREAAIRSREVSNSLLVTSVAQSRAEDELWARQLGVWAHLPEASDPAGLEMVFREARKALARQAARYPGALGHAELAGNSRPPMDKTSGKTRVTKRSESNRR